MSLDAEEETHLLQVSEPSFVEALMAHSHWRIRTRIPTRTRIPVLYKF